MKKYEQLLVSLILGGFVIVFVADLIRQVLVYLIVFAVLVVVFRLLLRDRL